MILQCTINVLLLPWFFVLLMYFFNWLLNLFFNHHNPCYLNVNYRSCFRRASSNFRLCIWIRRILKIRIIFVLHVKQSVKNFSNFIFFKTINIFVLNIQTQVHESKNLRFIRYWANYCSILFGFTVSLIKGETSPFFTCCVPVIWEIY